RSECNEAQWEEQISMMEMVLEPDALAAAVKGMRDEFSKFKL
ncbi:MAG: glycine/sarcosine/betaine reductase complex selenoprotein A, partial [Synergistaceae bacterium]